MRDEVSDLVEVAFVGNEHEAAMIQALLEERDIPSLQQQVGLDGRQLGYGALTGGVLAGGVLAGGGSRRVMVHAHRAEEARALLAAALAEGDAEIPEPVNAEYLEDASGGRKPRSYGLIGAYARICLWSLGAMALAFAVFMLLRAV